jgi:hypothetical protein
MGSSSLESRASEVDIWGFRALGHTCINIHRFHSIYNSAVKRYTPRIYSYSISSKMNVGYIALRALGALREILGEYIKIEKKVSVKVYDRD